MEDRSTPIGWRERIRTPKEVAQYFRTRGSTVGRDYKTYGDIWDIKPDVVQVGLLHLILDTLEEIHTPKLSPLEIHRIWLNHVRGEAERTLACHKKECDRISKFCDLKLLLDDANLSLFACIEYLRESHKRMAEKGQKYALHEIKEIRERTERLKLVQTLDDLEQLHGIGKKKADTIRAKMAKKSKEK